MAVLWDEKMGDVEAASKGACWVDEMVATMASAMELLSGNVGVVVTE